MTNREEVGRPKTEVGRPKTEDGRRKSEVGSWKLEVGRPKPEVGSWKLEVGRPKPEDRSRHGPSTRGDPDIRGKPPFIECANSKMREYINVPIRGKPPLGVGVYNSNITDLESSAPGSVILSEVERSLLNEVALYNMRFPIKLGMTARGKPGSWLQWKSRVLAAKNSVDFFGNFIPNGEWYAEKEAPPNLPKGKGQEKKKKNKENVEYRMMNNEYRSEDIEAPKGRNLIAQCEALGLNEHTTQIVPRLAANYDGAVSWGKNKTLLSDKNRLAHSEEAEKNRSLFLFFVSHLGGNPKGKGGFSQYIKNGSIKERKVAVSKWVSCLPDGRQGFRTAITDVRNGIRTTRKKKVAVGN